LTKVDWANIYLAYLDIIDVNVNQSVVSRKSVRQRGSRVPLIGRYNHFEHLLLGSTLQSLARLLLIGTANEPKERHDIRAENQPHVAQMLEAIKYVR
jgi:hypothetical protein